MGQVSAFVSRMTRRNSILLIAVAAALLAVLALSSLMSRGGPAPTPSAAPDAQTAAPDAQTAPASGAPPEAGGQADIIPPDEGGDDQGSADTSVGNSTDVEAPPP